VPTTNYHGRDGLFSLQRVQHYPVATGLSADATGQMQYTPALIYPHPGAAPAFILLLRH